MTYILVVLKLVDAYSTVDVIRIESSHMHHITYGCLQLRVPLSHT